MEIEQTDIDKIIPYASNARTHSDEQIAQIAASIKAFGFNNPILTDGDKGIIAGHGRVMAARKLNLKTVPTIELAHLYQSKTDRIGKYMIGMSVPPKMTESVARAVCEQWLA